MQPISNANESSFFDAILEQAEQENSKKTAKKIDLIDLPTIIADGLSNYDMEKNINKILKSSGYENFIIKSGSVKAGNNNIWFTVKTDTGKHIDFQVIVKMQPQ